MILHKKIYCKRTKNERKGYHNKIVWLRFVPMQDSWQRYKSDSTSWQKTLKNSHSFQNQWHVVSTLCQEMKNYLTRKVGFEGTPKLDPCWKAKAKPRRRTSACSSTWTVPIGERSWTDIEPETYSSIAHPVSKQLNTLLRHGHLPREGNGAIEFWRLKDDLQNKYENFNIGLMMYGRASWQKTEATRKYFNFALIHQDKKFFISELFKVIQNAIPLILHYRTMYEFRTISSSTFITSDLQSIYIPSRIQDWYREDRTWAKDRRYSLRLWILWTKNTEIRTKMTWKHRVLHRTSRKRGKYTKTLYWVDIQLAQQRGLKFYQTRSNVIILHDTLPAHCIPKATMMETREIIYEKVYASPRLPPKISFKDNWRKELGSEVAGGSEDSQQTQPKSKT